MAALRQQHAGYLARKVFKLFVLISTSATTVESVRIALLSARATVPQGEPSSSRAGTAREIPKPLDDVPDLHQASDGDDQHKFHLNYEVDAVPIVSPGGTLLCRARPDATLGELRQDLHVRGTDLRFMLPCGTILHDEQCKLADCALSPTTAPSSRGSLSASTSFCTNPEDGASPREEGAEEDLDDVEHLPLRNGYDEFIETEFKEHRPAYVLLTNNAHSEIFSLAHDPVVDDADSAGPTVADKDGLQSGRLKKASSLCEGEPGLHTASHLAGFSNKQRLSPPQQEISSKSACSGSCTTKPTITAVRVSKFASFLASLSEGNSVASLDPRSGPWAACGSTLRELYETACKTLDTEEEYTVELDLGDSSSQQEAATSSSADQKSANQPVLEPLLEEKVRFGNYVSTIDLVGNAILLSCDVRVPEKERAKLRSSTNSSSTTATGRSPRNNANPARPPAPDNPCFFEVRVALLCNDGSGEEDEKDLTRQRRLRGQIFDSVISRKLQSVRSSPSTLLAFQVVDSTKRHTLLSIMRNHCKHRWLREGYL
ncbi:unnamed protein product [Amoebophrya sp. A120]|nr:unnamed protein product [Amoebophrya sp. A120]|eukprot:GSA120T00004779001.1